MAPSGSPAEAAWPRYELVEMDSAPGVPPSIAMHLAEIGVPRSIIGREYQASNEAKVLSVDGVGDLVDIGASGLCGRIGIEPVTGAVVHVPVPGGVTINSQASERLRELADRARVTLIAVGIPAFDSKDSSPSGGARIEVDTGDDEAGGAYISWSFSRELTDEINGYLLSNQLSHVTIQYSGKVRMAMRDAIIAILNAAGLSARVSEDDMRPLAVSLSGD